MRMRSLVRACAVRPFYFRLMCLNDCWRGGKPCMPNVLALACLSKYEGKYGSITERENSVKTNPIENLTADGNQHFQITSKIQPGAIPLISCAWCRSGMPEYNSLVYTVDSRLFKHQRTRRLGLRSR